jgi:hypothetical protein
MARREEVRAREESQRKEEQRVKEKDVRIKKRETGRGKWVLLGVIGVIIAIRAWQRYKENTL